MADRYCKYCERENDDCLQRCNGWRETADLRNKLQVKVIELDELREKYQRLDAEHQYCHHVGDDL